MLSLLERQLQEYSAVASTSNLGDEVVVAQAVLTTTGTSATSALGTVSLVTINNLSVTGFSGTLNLGNETVIAKAVTLATGQVATFSLGRVLVYGLVDTSQTPNYNNVDASQTPNYSPVNTTQTPNYEEVA